MYENDACMNKDEQELKHMLKSSLLYCLLQQASRERAFIFIHLIAPTSLQD